VTSPRVITAATDHVPGDDAVGHGLVLDRLEPVDALDLQRARADAGQARAHLREHRAQVDDLRLARGVVDHRRALGERRRHEQVLGGADAGEVEPHARPAQLRRPGDEVAVLADDAGAELDQTGHVHVEPARADGVAARQGDLRLPAAGHERTEHGDGRADPPDQVVVGLVPGPLRHRDRDAAVAADHLAAEAPQHLAHDRHVEDVGHVGQDGGALGEQRGRHELQDAVLRAAHRDLSREPRATGDEEAVHPASLGSLRPAPERWGRATSRTGTAS
jgi:hypothetical protein